MVAEQIPPTSCSGRTSIHHPFSPYPVGANSPPPGPWPYKADGFWQIIEAPTAGSIPAGATIRDRTVRCWQPGKTGVICGIGAP